MFVAINRLKIKPGQGTVLEERFRQSKGLEQAEGFLRFQLFKQVWNPRGEQDHEEYLAMTEWTCAQAFHDWMNSDAFKRAHAGPRPDIFASPVEPGGYDIVVEREV